MDSNICSKADLINVLKDKSEVNRKYPEIGDNSDSDYNSHMRCVASEYGKNWSLQLARRLRYYSYESAGLAWQHDRDAQFYNSLNVKLTLWATLISSFSAVAVTGIMSLVNNNSLIGFYILSSITIVLNLTVAMLNAWKYVNNYVFKIIEHSEKSAKFGKLHRKIKNQFSSPLINRYDGKTLLEYTSDRFSELDREKPFIRKTTTVSWEKKTKKRNYLYDDLLALPYEFNNNTNDNSIILTDQDEKAQELEILR